MNTTQTQRIQVGYLDVVKPLYDFVAEELTPGTNVTPEHFWASLASIVAEFGEKNARLLKTRDELQAKIDAWHRTRKGCPHENGEYRAFLTEIGYLAPAANDFQVSTTNVDAEIAKVAGPQLVVPLDNSRYVLNAANARWGSLYNALYGTDAIPESDGCLNTPTYNPIRGDKVIAYVRALLDRHFALENSTHRHVTRYKVVAGNLVVEMGDGSNTRLLRPERFAGYTGAPAKPDTVLLRKNGLHLELRFGEGYFIGRKDHAHIYDVHSESALSTIMDCEDSVAAVDGQDKLVVYGNWLGLMKGTLTSRFEKDDEIVDRKLAKDRTYLDPDGRKRTLSGRSLMLVRNVGAHLDTDMVTYQGRPIAEMLLDAMVTALAGKHDLTGASAFHNSREGSIYIVKPKMHGPEEVAAASRLFSRVEDALGLGRNTLKMGIMDEERRTSVNLRSCIAAAKERIFFINTGFLDRTGDEIHTSMEAGPMLPKAEMKTATWLRAYEDANVDTGLAAGLMGHAQIGKGMWAMPEEMAAMLDTKIAHAKAGANTAWVPSPTAATLHSLHYFLLDVTSRQRDILERSHVHLDDLLTIPIMQPGRRLTDRELQTEVDNNAQSILGYVARWVGQGVGCSKVPDIHNVALMEDCATLRISSQHIANWLHHGLISEEQVRAAMEHMAIFVDRQNAGDRNYRPMARNFDDSIPFQAAIDLVLQGREQPNGYTEYILQDRRRQVKAEG